MGPSAAAWPADRGVPLVNLEEEMVGFLVSWGIVLGLPLPTMPRRYDLGRDFLQMRETPGRGL